MDIKLLSSGFKITEPQTKKTSFSNTIYIYKIVIDIFFLVIICKLFSFRIFLSAFFHPNFVIRIRYPHPSSAGIRSAFYRHPFSTGFTREFKQRCFSANHVNRKWSFWTLRPYFEQIRGQIVSIRVKSFSKTNLVASRYIKREKRSLPVDVRCSRWNVAAQTPYSTICHLYRIQTSKRAMSRW